MKNFIALALVGAASAQQMLVSDTIEKNPFGALVQTQVYGDRIIKTIAPPTEPYVLDYSQQAEAIIKLTDTIKAKKFSNEDEPIYTCSNREPGADPSSFGQFLPVYVTSLTPNSTTYTYTASKCFDQMDFTFETVSESQFNVHVTTSGKKGLACKEAFFFANTEIYHPEIFMFQGQHTLQFQIPTAEAQADVGFGGIKVYEFCDGLVQGLESVWVSLQAFVGGLTVDPNRPGMFGSHVPPYMEKANVAFMHEAMGYDLVARPTTKVEIDPDLIQDGDFIAIMRLDGLDPIIMYGSGSHVGHSTMALRFDGELYIVESQAAWYWPTKSLQRTKWADWIQSAEDVSFHVSWLPLRDDVRANFNSQAAQDFFFQTEGLPYGFHNFLYGWIDTTRNNLPGLLANEFMPILFAMIEQILPTTAQNFFAQALNFRLGTTGLNIEGLAAAAAKQGLSVQDVMAMPELDGWEYTGIEPRDGLAYVCSAYVAAMYKAAGLFGDLPINATEFTPRDVYMLDFFDTTYQRPQACIDADPDLPYCQILGNYRMTLPDYSTISPYANMNERCASVWPDYIREDGC